MFDPDQTAPMREPTRGIRFEPPPGRLADELIDEVGRAVRTGLMTVVSLCVLSALGVYAAARLIPTPAGPAAGLSAPADPDLAVGPLALIERLPTTTGSTTTIEPAAGPEPAVATSPRPSPAGAAPTTARQVTSSEPAVTSAAPPVTTVPPTTVPPTTVPPTTEPPTTEPPTTEPVPSTTTVPSVTSVTTAEPAETTAPIPPTTEGDGE